MYAYRNKKPRKASIFIEVLPMPRKKAAASMLPLATLSLLAFAQDPGRAVREPMSALNYVSGQAMLDGAPVTTDPNRPPQPLHPGQVLATRDGAADVMFTPGTLLRLGADTRVELVASDAGRAEVRIDGGRANIAVNTAKPARLTLVDLPGGQIQIRERGLYTFDTASETVKVFNGEAYVYPGADTDTKVKAVKVKDQQEAVLGEDRIKPTKFDRMEDQTDLLPWSGPEEAHADGQYGLVGESGTSGAAYAGTGYGYGYGYGSGAYGFAGPYGFAGAYGGSYGWGYPYGLYGYPYGFIGYPFGVGLGLGFGGYGGVYPGRGYGYPAPIHGGHYGGIPVRPGYAAGGGYHGAGGVGFHGGGGAGRR